MKICIIMRGLPGCGKSTFIKENHLEPYTVSSDSLRLIYASTDIDINGNLCISQKENKLVWEKIAEAMDIRFRNGLFTVFDATNIKIKNIQFIMSLAKKYSYKLYCIDMTDVPLSVVKERNKNRDTFRVVPESVIDKMHKDLSNQKLPAYIKTIQKEELQQMLDTKKEISDWKAVHFIGDIHGCYDALMKLIDNQIKDDELYIFCGDYCDRGIQNAEVLNFILSIYEKKNIICIKGNHELHIENWIYNKEIHSYEFKNNTKKELEQGNINQQKVKHFCRYLQDFVHFSYNGKTIFACHGCIPCIPQDPATIESIKYIKGAGKYEDYAVIEDNFMKNTNSDTYFVHGHINIDNECVQARDRVYNLEGAVEFGGNIRMVTFTKNGIETKEIKNTVLKNVYTDNTKDTPAQTATKNK